jgi:polyhydroxybutyrate depolymerase
MMNRFSVLAGAAILALAPVAAEACGMDAPCVIPGGEYFAVSPEGPRKGAVLFLHGWGGKAKADIANARVVEPLLARGYVVIAPVGLPFSDAEPITNWNAEEDPGFRDDVAFIDAVMDDAALRFDFARDRVLAAGFSLGGMMVWRLACDAPADYAAFAPVSGTFWEPMPETCAAPVRLLHFHGWTDRMVPLEGRPIEGTPMVQGDVFAALAVARSSSGCTSRAIHEDLGDREVRSWVHCAAGASIGIVLHPGGHMVPKGWADFVLDWYEGEAPPAASACLAGGGTEGKC